MKRAFASFSAALTVATAWCQGTVNLHNPPAILISAGPVGQEMPIGGPPGSYYFGLLIAQPGTADPRQFTFSGVYATNAGPNEPGRLNGGDVVAVQTWPTGTTMSFLIAGWSSSLSHDWNQQWLSGSFGSAGFFGLSSIATETAGGPSGGVPVISPLLLGGPAGIPTGWNLAPVPEPSTAALGVIAAATLLFSRRGRKYS
jgi:hypothetical protein